MKIFNSLGISVLVLHLTFCFVLGKTNPDEIQQLPGLKYKINFKQYSGYLNASSGKYLHYWFVESQKTPATDPVVLWMNGGPGCSSLDGFLSELGPFHVKTDGQTLYDNPFAWNKVANVIFLEAPAGVGFSYSDSKDYSTDDDTVSMDNYLALQHFFQKFPQFKKNDFYVTGESYGGIYVPTLSVRLLNTSSSINFKGFAVGNGFLDSVRLTNSIIFFAYYHGLLSNSLWTELTKYCCNGVASQDTCNFAQPPSSQCTDAVQKAQAVIQFSGLNVYNLYDDCSPSASAEHSRLVVDSRNLMRLFPHSRFLSLKGAPPCIDERNISSYLNQNSVRTALHIPSFVQKWDICSSDVEFGYRRIYDTMAPQVLTLLQNGKRGLVYNGDVDMACNFLGDSWFSDSLGLSVVKDYQEWHFDNQVAGFFKQYKGLTFLTIKGSGHMVPQDKPGPAFKMISSFLYNKPYD